MNKSTSVCSAFALAGAFFLPANAAQAQTLGTCVYGTSLIGANVELTVENGRPIHYTNNRGFSTDDVEFVDGNTAVRVGAARLKFLSVGDGSFKARWTYQGSSKTATWRCK